MSEKEPLNNLADEHYNKYRPFRTTASTSMLDRIAIHQDMILRSVAESTGDDFALIKDGEAFYSPNYLTVLSRVRPASDYMDRLGFREISR